MRGSDWLMDVLATVRDADVRLTPDEALEICAPLGLDDLLGGVWRRNPRRVSSAQSRVRLARHRPEARFPA